MAPGKPNKSMRSNMHSCVVGIDPNDTHPHTANPGWNDCRHQSPTNLPGQLLMAIGRHCDRACVRE
jgi:hypothetical protein